MAFESKWGGFDSELGCYVITRPDTPGKWQNYLYSKDGKFQVVVTQRGDGDGFYLSRNANLFSKGRNYSLFDKGNGECWSLNGGYSPISPAEYRCEHHPGRTVFKVDYDGISSELSIVVHPEKYIEVNQLKLRNNSGRQREFSLIGFYEGVLEGINNGNQIQNTHLNKEMGAVISRRYHFGTHQYKYASFYVSDKVPNSFSGAFDSFFDSDVERSKASVWKKGVLANVNAYATDISPALQHDVVIEPNQEFAINYGFGIADNIEEAEWFAQEFFDNGVAGEALAKSKSFFNDIVNDNKLATGNNVIDKLFNVWTKIQLHRQVISSRFSDFHNWRNNLQDAWGWLIYEPQLAKDYLREICSLADEDGFMRRSSVRVEGVIARIESVCQKHADIATWAVTLASNYAYETGDIDFFFEKIKYADAQKEATVIECLIHGIKWLLNHRGQHGMILMLDGDWSDPLEEAGRKGIGESPWTSVALVNSIRNIVPFLRKIDLADLADELVEHADNLARAVNQYAWDGQWYIRGITDDGVRFCKSDDPDANVSLMMQAWAIMSGVVTPERKGCVLKAIDDYVKTDIGPILYGPPFLKWRQEIGRETVKQPGTGENGSVYVHGAMMLAMAEIKAGRPDEALEIITQVLPLREKDCTSVTKAIPLWMPNFYHGPHSPLAGLSSGIISTGAPAWFCLDIVNGFLGIQPELDGLRVNPALPHSWNDVTFERNWRGATYNFIYKRCGKGDCVSVMLNGEILEDGLIPVPSNCDIYNVDVIIGSENQVGKTIEKELLNAI
ncbi:MAG: GH36-type glycosyl hydrolase domain-containing protein [Sedimentisphaeraceae bacterium JB056]